VDLCDAIRAALPDPEFEEFDDLTNLSIRELAELWSGKGSGREYLNARRRFERYFTGLGKSKRGGQEARRGYELDEFLDELRDRFRGRRRAASKGVTVTITGEVRVSKDKRRRTIHDLELEGGCVDRILDLLDADDCESAEEAFEECLGEAGGFGQTPEWTDVDRLVMV
jgi:hypothetical protein